ERDVMISPTDYILSVGSESILFAHKVDLLIEEDEIDEALELCEEGVKRFPFYAEGYIQLARCYQLKNMNDDAVNAYQQALKLQPNHTKALKGLAYLYYKMREREAGEITLLKAYLFDPYDEELHDFLESEGLLARLYSPLVFDDEDEDSSQHDGAMFDLEEILDDSRPTDEDERNQILEEIDEHSRQVGENELFELEPASAEEEIEKIDESFFEAESGINEEESDSFPEELAAVSPGLGENEAEEEMVEEKEEAEPDVQPEEAPKRRGDEREEFTQFMSDLFKPDETNDEESRQEKSEVEKEEQQDEMEMEDQIASELDTILIFSDHRKSDEPVSEEEDDEEAKPLGDFNTLEEDLERIGAAEFEEIENNLVEPEAQEEMQAPEAEVEQPADDDRQESKESGQEMNELLKRLEEGEKRRDETKARKKQIAQLESQAESDNVDIDDILSNPSLLTPTFGEILIAQHKFEDALKVFTALAKKEPDNPRIQKKIEFLKKLVMAKK
ncbi:tetratricopeptide repeat protein, partial [Caldithrix abyssi]